jgi:hypothetical protein
MTLLKVFFFLIYISWGVPLFGKNFLPQLFNNYTIQTSASYFTSISIALGSLIAIRLFLFKKEKKALKYAFVFVLPLIYSVVAYCSFLISATPLFTTLVVNDSEVQLNSIIKITNRINNSNDLNEKNRLRESLFQSTGIIISIDDNGKSVPFEPTSYDLDKMEKGANLRTEKKELIKMLSFQFINMPKLLMIYLLPYFFILSLGLFISFYKINRPE